jgi:hypothetical protein
VRKEAYVNVHLWMAVGLSRLVIATVLQRDTALATVELTSFAERRALGKPTPVLQFVGQKEKDMLNNVHSRSH